MYNQQPYFQNQAAINAAALAGSPMMPMGAMAMGFGGMGGMANFASMFIYSGNAVGLQCKL